MSNGKQIIRAFGADGAKTDAKSENAGAEFRADVGEPQSDEVFELDQSDEYFEEEPAIASSRTRWILPSLAILGVVAWTVFYGWAIRDQVLQASPVSWTGWIANWAIPVLLLGVAWLIAMRNSHSEARRFAATAATLRQESEALDHRLTVVNRELSLAREFLAAQSRDLESLGRIASEKLATHASELQSLIHDNGAQVDRIGSASQSALENMNRLRDDLPVVANSARDVTNQIGNAGRTAHEQVEKLVSGFERLNQFGTASENQVASLGKRVNEILGGFESQLNQIENLLGTRFAQLKENTGSYRDEITKAEQGTLAALNERITLLQSETKAVAAKLREAEQGAMEQLRNNKDRLRVEVTEMVESLDRLDRAALESAKKRIDELQGEAERFDQTLAHRDARFMEEMERRQASFETRETQATEILAQRLADLDEAIAERRESQIVETEKLVSHSRDMSEQLDRLAALIGNIEQQGVATRESLTEGMGALGEQLEAKRAALVETGGQLEKLTEAGVRLLEIINSGAQQARENLPSAIGQATEALSSAEDRARAISELMLNTSQSGNDLGNYLIKAQDTITETDSSIEALNARLGQHSDETIAKLNGLRGGFARMAEEAHGFASETRGALREAIEQLEAATRSAFAALDDGAREKIHKLTEELSAEAVEALERSLRNQSAETIGKLEQAAAHASGVGREATIQLRDQLAKVNELTGNLEQRVARARELAEEQVNNDFARRMSLITDSLNSNAIDITAALSQDVTDTAWDAYLKGDRGIFTRRAVRLIDSGEAREIADLYQQDETFKANVARYIHDFEKMLRSMLSTRDGNALGVTVLGSDMGKLYVVLAQATERFRA